MKRSLVLIAVAVVIVMMLGAVASAADSPAQVTAVESDETEVATVSGASVQEDGIVTEPDMVIDLRLVTTLIISICSVLTVGVVVMVVYLGRKNRK